MNVTAVTPLAQVAVVSDVQSISLDSSSTTAAAFVKFVGAVVSGQVDIPSIPSILM